MAPALAESVAAAAATEFWASGVANWVRKAAELPVAVPPVSKDARQLMLASAAFCAWINAAKNVWLPQRESVAFRLT